MPTRLWEFLAGFITAHWLSKIEFKNPKFKYINVLSIFGYLVVLKLPINFDSGSPIWGHPGIIAFGVTLITCIYLYVGLPRVIMQSWPSTFLAKIGDYSFSIYLVHFPILVLINYKIFEGTITTTRGTDVLIASLLILLASISVYRFIETPFRTSKYKLRTLLIPIVLIIGISMFGEKIQKYQYSNYEWNVLQVNQDQDNYRCGKIFRIRHPFSDSCIIGRIQEASSAKPLMLIGNSHANSIKRSFAKIANENLYSVHFLVGNDPLMAGGSTAKEVFNEILKVGASTIVLHYSQDAFIATELAELNKLCIGKNIRVVFIMPVVHWSNSVPDAIVNRLESGMPLPIQTLGGYNAVNDHLIKFLDNFSNIEVYQSDKYLCRDVCKLADESGHPYYLDGNHLTLTGSKLLEPIFEEILS